MSKSKEAELSKVIVTYLNSLQNSFFYKNYSGPMSTKGIHDIIGCYKGKFLSFEVKLPTNTKGMSTNQIEFMRNVHKALGFSFEVRNLDDVKNSMRMVELSFIY